MLTEREKFIVLVDNDLIQKSDAIILLEGDGFNRYQHAVKLYKNGVANQIIFSGGIVDYKYGSFPYEDILPHLLDEGIEKNAIIHEAKSLNTREQAIEVIKIAKTNKWKRLILVASPEHQPRAYLTFLKEIFNTNSEIILYNSSARNLEWFTASDWGIRFERMQLEFERIENYSQLGHLASFEEAIKYQKWKEQQ